MNNRIHPADGIHLTGQVPGLRRTAQVADHDSRRARHEAAERRYPLAGTGVQDNLMAVTHQGPGGEAAEPVCRAGDKDT